MAQNMDFEDRFLSTREENRRLKEIKNEKDRELTRLKADLIRARRGLSKTKKKSRVRDRSEEDLIDSLRDKNLEQEKMIKKLMRNQRMTNIGARRSGKRRGGRRRPSSARSSTRSTQHKPMDPLHEHSPDRVPTRDYSASSPHHGSSRPLSPSSSSHHHHHHHGHGQHSSSSPRQPHARNDEERQHYQTLSETLLNRLSNSQNGGGSSYGTASGQRPASARVASLLGYSDFLDKIPNENSYNQSNYPDDDVVKGNAASELVELRREMREKMAKMATLQDRFNKLGLALRAEKDIQKNTLNQVEELTQKLLASQKREKELQSQLDLADLNSDQVAEMRLVIQDLETRNKTLEEAAKVLNINMFQGDNLEKMRMKKIVTEHTIRLQSVRDELEEKTKALDNFKNELNDTLRELKDQQQLNERLTSQKKNLEKQLSAAVKKMTNLADRLAVFSADSGVDLEDLERALDIVRREREDPSRVKFLYGDAGDELEETVPALKRKIHETEIINKDLMEELQNQKDLLVVQQKMHKDSSRVFALAQREKTNLQIEVKNLKYELARRTANNDYAASISSLFANSEVSTISYSGLQNMVAIRIVSAKLDDNFPLFSDGMPTTVCAVDFHAFETSWSAAFGGFHPKYSFTSQYPVVMDSLFIEFLESDVCDVEIYKQQSGVRGELVGVAHVPLKKLMEPYGNARDVCKIEIINEDLCEKLGPGPDGQVHPQAIVGTLKYILCMRRSVVDAAPDYLDSESDRASIASNSDSIMSFSSLNGFRSGHNRRSKNRHNNNNNSQLTLLDDDDIDDGTLALTQYNVDILDTHNKLAASAKQRQKEEKKAQEDARRDKLVQQLLAQDKEKEKEEEETKQTIDSQHEDTTSSSNNNNTGEDKNGTSAIKAGTTTINQSIASVAPTAPLSSSAGISRGRRHNVVQESKYDKSDKYDNLSPSSTTSSTHPDPVPPGGHRIEAVRQSVVQVDNEDLDDIAEEI